MLCRVEMPSHEALFGRFYRWKLMHPKKVNGRGFIGLPIAMLVFALLMLLLGTPWKFVLVIAIIVVAYMLYIMYAKPNSIYRKKEGAALQTIVYIFTDTGFTRSAKSEEGGLPETVSSQYAVLTKAVETSKDFYLFTGIAQAYLVDKAYFTKGSADELREILRKQLGNKFESKL